MERRNTLDWRRWLEYAKRGKKAALPIRHDEEQARILAKYSHEIMELALKALHICVKGEHAEKTHDLSRLADLVREEGFTISDEERGFLSILDNYFLPLRYPQNGAALPTYEKAVELFDKACRLLERIEAELTQGEE